MENGSQQSDDPRWGTCAPGITKQRNSAYRLWAWDGLGHQQGFPVTQARIVETGDLAQAGKILMCNFFMEYQTGGSAPFASRYGKMKATLQVSMDVELAPEAYIAVNRQFGEVLDTIRPTTEPPDE